MERKKKIIIGIVLIAAIGGIAYWLYSKNKSGSGGLGLVGKKKWKFTDNTYTSTGKSNSNLGFIGLTQPPFNVGDVIDIKQSSGATFPSYDGTTTVEHIYETPEGKYVMDVHKKRLGDTGVNPGVAKLV